MNKHTHVTPIGGSLHSFRFQVPGGPAEGARYTSVENHPDFNLRATAIVRHLGELAFRIGHATISVPVAEHQFGTLIDGDGGLTRRLQNIIHTNRQGITQDPATLRIVVASPLGAVGAYTSNIGRTENILPYGWPCGFRNIFDTSTGTPRVIDQYATGVFIPRPTPKNPPKISPYRTALPPEQTTLLNGMKDEAIVGGVWVPRTPEPLSLITKTDNIGQSAEGIPFMTGTVVGLHGLDMLRQLPRDTSILVYSDVYRLAQRLDVPPAILERMFVGGQTQRGPTHTQLQSFGSLNKIHPSNLQQAVQYGL